VPIRSGVPRLAGFRFVKCVALTPKSPVGWAAPTEPGIPGLARFTFVRCVGAPPNPCPWPGLPGDLSNLNPDAVVRGLFDIKAVLGDVAGLQAIKIRAATDGFLLRSRLPIIYN
jgi:hypothetical protein